MHETNAKMGYFLAGFRVPRLTTVISFPFLFRIWWVPDLDATIRRSPGAFYLLQTAAMLETLLVNESD